MQILFIVSSAIHEKTGRNARRIALLSMKLHLSAELLSVTLR
jgi:hypothetical protein